MFHADLLGGWEHGFRSAEVDDHLAGLEPLDNAREDVAFLAGVLVEDNLALRFTEALQDHLLRGLRGDASRDAYRVVLDERLSDLDI